jgi:drug/metabolite transporter (DMT)-like permease
MDSRPGDETLLLAVAERDMGAFRMLYERHAGGLALPWTAAGLALAGNVLLGFAAACVVRTRTGEPGAATGTAVVLVLMAPSLVPHVARWVRTFPAPGADGPSSDHVWWIVLAVCVVAIAISIGGRNLPRWMSSVP